MNIGQKYGYPYQQLPAQSGKEGSPVVKVSWDEPPDDSFMKVDPDTKVWVLHGSHTGGHASAARSLEQALEKFPGVDAEVINMAETSSAKTSASKAAEVALKGGAWVRSIRRYVFDQQYKGHGFIKWASNKAMAWEGDRQDAFLQRLEAEKPDILVSTMSATNSLLSHWKEEGEIEQPVHSVLTDFASHQMWAQENIAEYYVATPQVQGDLEKFGVDSEDINVTGIPIKSTFAEPVQKPSEARKELGLKPDVPLVLMLGGSLGYGAFAENLEALDVTGESFQMAAITGRNKDLKAELESLETNKDLTVEGYTKQMSTWLDAADIVITKPGGLTASEILAKGKPMILQQADGGLEGRMVERLAETGAAVVVDGPEEMASAISSLFKEPGKLEELKTRAAEVGKPNSSDEIARSILDAVAD